LPCAAAHSAKAFVFEPNGLFGGGIDGAAEGELRFVGVATLKDADVRGAANQQRRRVVIGNQAEPLLAVQPRAGHEVEQLMARQVFAGLGVILIGRFGDQHAEVNHEISFVILRHHRTPLHGTRRHCRARRRVITRSAFNLAATPETHMGRHLGQGVTSRAHEQPG
jgi:hypothetical protein